MINVLSLFDGMSCGQIALTDMGVKIGKYYAAEIDKHAIAQTKLNFPGTVHVGSVTNWREWNIDWSSINIIMGGSPCQGFSFAGKQLAFDDPRSVLFFEFVAILNHCRKYNPNVIFLLENVKMKHEHELVISKYMGVAPIEINAALVSAQNRVRLFWTNIKNEPYGFFGDMQCTIPQPKDRGILLRDVLEDEVEEKYYLSEKAIKFVTSEMRLQKKYTQNATEAEKSLTHLAKNQTNWCGDFVCVASRGRNPENPKSRQPGLETEQQLEPRFDGKTNCLTSVQKDNLVMQINPSKESGGKQPYQQNRIYDSNGIATALCANKTDLLITEATTKGYAEIKPGDCFDATMPTSKTRRGRSMEVKSNCLTAAKFDFMQYTNNHRIRRLTPTECSRLQSIPTWYKWNCSDTQIYRMLGNGWNVEVIKHILTYIV